MPRECIHFMQSEHDRELNKVELLLGKDPKVERTERESINHYSVPDSFNLDGRFLLRVDPEGGQYETLKTGLLDRIRVELGDRVASEINLTAYAVVTSQIDLGCN